MSRRDAQGTVYLLHFSEPYKHARHYTGWTEDLPARLGAHGNGRGARLMEVIKVAGIGFPLARTWPRDQEPRTADQDPGRRQPALPRVRRDAARPAEGGRDVQ